MANQGASHDLMEKLVSLAKRRGFIYPGSEIYGGLAGTWDFGPLGVALKNNIKNAWRKKFIDGREDMYEIDAALLMNPKVWETSGHVGGFNDPLVECKKCGKRFRVDQIVDTVKYSEALHERQNQLLLMKKRLDDDIKVFQSDYEIAELNINAFKSDVVKFLQSHPGLQIDSSRVENLSEAINEVNQIKNDVLRAVSYTGYFPYWYLSVRDKTKCPNCKNVNWNIPVQFNMMFKTQVGAVEDSAATVYFRPETAQGMFVNFKNIVDSFSPKLPFGIAQIGKAFRNEITPKDFIFRVREFEQMEIEYFVDPRNIDQVNETFEELYNDQINFLKEIGIDETRLHKIEVPESDRAHYSARSVDTEFDFPFGQKELLGLANRTDYDLKAHIESSGAALTFFDEATKEKFVPYCIEPTFGVERLVLALLTSAYKEDEQGGEVRNYLAFKPKVAPIICAVSPLLKNRPELQEKAREVFGILKKEFGRVMYDDNGNVGKRYRRQDEIGTPWCIVVDFDTIGSGENINPDFKDMVTIRDRDTGNQERIAISDIVSYIQSRI